LYVLQGLARHLFKQGLIHGAKKKSARTRCLNAQIPQAAAIVAVETLNKAYCEFTYEFWPFNNVLGTGK